jgi:putative NIF3 family GTP cyclohydrolase 1 type 2
VSGNTPWRFVFPETTLGDFALAMADRLKSRSMRIVGNPHLRIRRVATNWGYASLMPSLIKVAANPDVDLMIVGETREWELVEYVQDQISSGAKKALIVLNHVVSEQAGMEYCTEWLQPIVPEVRIAFVPSAEPFWVPRT